MMKIPGNMLVSKTCGLINGFINQLIIREIYQTLDWFYYDLNLITEMDLIQNLDEKVSFANLSDSCYSGGLIDNKLDVLE
ncbi:hypothetical protein V6N11_006202 [Hibiscus sabdariffa]|uniref:Uncharacterized protein n=1 Tax=Hibiscus sabdariffa TaxID=183260 RepID=A0ABR2RQD8_9ROSI